MLVRILARSDFSNLGFNGQAKSVQNWNVRLPAIWALMGKPNLSEIGTFGYRQFGLKLNDLGPKYSKSERFMSEIRTKIVRILDNWALKSIRSEIKCFSLV